ncbi:unnamed protein product [Vitrella brassicaformis CCMP3155]|uniref:J domain-containing protein n=1 Tax=Vitrella brassicaformis (strain CCMP3155) TaxID=1169540 RepID=A0A0G4ELP3_VITBC|nr:unnamed protein product [Vitrella brassicaformis CCMP3155]|eukprot:CEL97939.1 unnamed protein product [Vitrella brassicaformis CCMP3155]
MSLPISGVTPRSTLRRCTSEPQLGSPLRRVQSEVDRYIRSGRPLPVHDTPLQQLEEIAAALGAAFYGPLGESVTSTSTHSIKNPDCTCMESGRSSRLLLPYVADLVARHAARGLVPEMSIQLVDHLVFPEGLSGRTVFAAEPLRAAVRSAAICLCRQMMHHAYQHEAAHHQHHQQVQQRGDAQPPPEQAFLGKHREVDTGDFEVQPENVSFPMPPLWPSALTSLYSIPYPYDVLGRGTFGIVVKAYCRLPGDPVAIKVIFHLDDLAEIHAQEEIDKMNQLSEHSDLAKHRLMVTAENRFVLAHYVVLGVSPFASRGEVEDAWKKCRKWAHPDRKILRDGMIFSYMNTAQQLLLDEDKREAYDHKKGVSEANREHIIALWKHDCGRFEAAAKPPVPSSAAGSSPTNGRTVTPSRLQLVVVPAKPPTPSPSPSPSPTSTPPAAPAPTRAAPQVQKATPYLPPTAVAAHPHPNPHPHPIRHTAEQLPSPGYYRLKASVEECERSGSRCVGRRYHCVPDDSGKVVTGGAAYRRADELGVPDIRYDNEHIEKVRESVKGPNWPRQELWDKLDLATKKFQEPPYRSLNSLLDYISLMLAYRRELRLTAQELVDPTAEHPVFESMREEIARLLSGWSPRDRYEPTGSVQPGADHGRLQPQDARLQAAHMSTQGARAALVPPHTHPHTATVSRPPQPSHGAPEPPSRSNQTRT